MTITVDKVVRMNLEAAYVEMAKDRAQGKDEEGDAL
jgi:hypothetical protein